MFTTISFLDKHDKFLEELLCHKFIVFSPETIDEAEVVVSFDINKVPQLLQYRDKLRVLLLFSTVKGKELELLRQNNDKILVITPRNYQTIKNIKVVNRIKLRAKQVAYIIKAVINENKLRNTAL